MSKEAAFRRHMGARLYQGLCVTGLQPTCWRFNTVAGEYRYRLLDVVFDNATGAWVLSSVLAHVGEKAKECQAKAFRITECYTDTSRMGHVDFKVRITLYK